SLAAREGDLIPRDRALLRQLRGDGVGGVLGGRVRSAFPALYRDGRAVLSASGDGWRLAAEPLAVLSYGPVRQTARAEQEQGGEEGQEAWARGYRSTRGVRGAGHLDAGPGLFFFEMRAEENRVRPPIPEGRRLTAPRLGFAYTGGGVYDYF